jgi:hypothetical protein
MGFVFFIAALFITALIVDAVKILWRRIRKMASGKKLKPKKPVLACKAEMLHPVH